MIRIRSHAGMVFLLALLALLVACGGSGEDSATATRDEEWDALKSEHDALTATRAEIASLRMQLVEARIQEATEPVAAEEATEAEEPTEEGATEEGATETEAVEPMTAEEIEAKLAEFESEVVTQAEDFGTHLVEFINADPLYQGEEPSPRQKAAFGLKSSEDVILGQEYIDKGGDYRRAIEIFEAALMIDPDNQEVIAALEAAKANRFMIEERFALVSKGMGQDQVRNLIGQVYHHNVRDYPEKEVVAWFYPKEEGAAGVYFQLHKKSETYQVYRVDFNAVKAATEEGDEGELAEPDAP